MKKLLSLSVVLILLSVEITAQCTSCYNPTNTGTYSSTLGRETVSTGESSFASGLRSQADADFTTAIGYYAFATYTKSMAFGSMVKANMDKSIVIGSGFKNADIYLENNVPRSLMIGFTSKNPTFFVVEPYEQNQEFTKTGRISIGNVTDPQAKLHIRSDEEEEATVFIETRSWDEGVRASIGLGNAFHGITAINNVGLQFHTQLYYTFNEGNVGINTTKPDYNLHVEGSLFTKQFTLFDEHNMPRSRFILVSDEEGNGFWADPVEFGLWRKNLNNETDIYFTDGNVGIGTIDTYGYRLTVDGKILTDEVMVTHPVTWHDYVFASDYKLITLYELEKFVNANHHLPDIPSEAQITEQGFSLGEMDGLLLKKIEELTLYIIEQEKRLDRQALEIQELKTRTSN